MKKTLLLILLCFCTTLAAQEDIIGYWKTFDENTGKAQSIIGVYKYQDKYFGRLIATYEDNGQILDTINDPQVKAPGVVGEPYYAGMDIIWNVKDTGEKYEDGSILDPEKGYVYGVEMWRQGVDLVVRGELLFIGRNQTWKPVKDSDFPAGFKKPDLNSLVPKIPVAK